MPPRGEGIPMRQGVGNNHEGGAGSDGTGSFGSFVKKAGKVTAEGVAIGVVTAGSKALQRGVEDAVEQYNNERVKGNPRGKSLGKAVKEGAKSAGKEFVNQFPKEAAKGVIKAGAARIIEAI